MTHTTNEDRTTCATAWDTLADFWQEELMKAAEQPESTQNVIRANLKEAVGEAGRLRQMIAA